MEEVEPQDAMITLAALVSRVEALVVASMLEANGIPVFVGGAGHASVEVNSLALGGHRLWISVSHHRIASELLLEVRGDDEWSFSYGLRRSVLRVIGTIAAVYVSVTAFLFSQGLVPLIAITVAPLGILSLPVNPQGRGDYYLHEAVK